VESRRGPEGGDEWDFPSQERDGNARESKPQVRKSDELPAFEIHLKLNYKVLLVVLSVLDLLHSTIFESVARGFRGLFR